MGNQGKTSICTFRLVLKLNFMHIEGMECCLFAIPGDQMADRESIDIMASHGLKPCSVVGQLNTICFKE